MKSMICLALLTLTSFNLSAQSASKLNPELKPGSVFEFSLDAQGQTMPMLLKLASIGADGIAFDYEIAGSMVGKFINGKTNLEKATSLNWDQPAQGEERKLSDDQTIGMVSSSFFSELKKQGKGKYDGIDLMLKEQPKGTETTSGGREVDAIYAESADGATRIWILNNDQYPIILRLEGHPSGISLICKDIH